MNVILPFPFKRGFSSSKNRVIKEGLEDHPKAFFGWKGEVIMGKRLATPCGYPCCPALTQERYCSKHKRMVRKQYEQNRGSSYQRGYDHRWRKRRLSFLKEHPLCVACLKEDRTTPASVVDHIHPHKGETTLFWDESNWQALCKPCHDRKTALQDGGFGR
jgi:5-methylcytosine-specific restriction protein A